MEAGEEMKPVSKQRLKQIRNNQAGLCAYCNDRRKPGYVVCEFHAEKLRKYQRDRDRLKKGVPLDAPLYTHAPKPPDPDKPRKGDPLINRKRLAEILS
jgi:hypothetical protein